eukprot:m.116126 g.116126  ORF g.116126 m.116126 type:complete len:473 (-) comp13594_c2_seq2:305-1723(-)
MTFVRHAVTAPFFPFETTTPCMCINVLPLHSTHKVCHNNTSMWKACAVQIVRCTKQLQTSARPSFGFVSRAVQAPRSLLSSIAARPAINPLVVSVARSASTSAATAASASGTLAAEIAGSQRTIGMWLLGCSAMIYGAVVIGGITRLTESGLSMVKWHPIHGMKPPMTQAEWEEEFECYKKYPEYKYSSGMTLEDFKKIFFWEYLHRMWGRTIGVVFIIPAAYFWARGKIRPQFKPVILTIGALLGWQGVLGWIMVKSGLEYDPEGKHVPRVSQYKLTAHLFSAFLLYVVTFWTAMSHFWERPALEAAGPIGRRVKFLTHLCAGLVFITAMSGGFVAGMDAGLIYNEFPKMGEGWIPSDVWLEDLGLKNIFENPTTAQFDHRYLGITTGTLVAATYALSRFAPLPPRARTAALSMLAMVGVQITLGISTLVYLVPTELAAAHQAGSLALLSCVMWFMHEQRHLRSLLKRPPL